MLEKTTQLKTHAGSLLMLAIIIISLLDIAANTELHNITLPYAIGIVLPISQMIAFKKGKEAVALIATIAIVIFEYTTHNSTAVQYIAWLFIFALLSYRKQIANIFIVSIALLLCTLYELEETKLTALLESVFFSFALMLVVSLFGLFIRVNIEASYLAKLGLKQFNTVMFSGLLGPLFYNIRDHTAAIRQGDYSDQATAEAIAIDQHLNEYEPALSLYTMQTPEPEELIISVDTQLKDFGYRVQINNRQTNAITVAVEQYLWCAIICQQISRFLTTSKGAKLKISLDEDEYHRSLTLTYKIRDKIKNIDSPADELLHSYFNHFQITTNEKFNLPHYSIEFHIPKTLG